MRFVWASMGILLLSPVHAGNGLPPLRPHPRLYADAGRFVELKAGMVTNEFLRAGAEGVRVRADFALKRPLPRHGVTDGRRMLSTSRAVLWEVGNLAMAYRLFGDDRYLKGAAAILDAAAAMPDWNPSHFLDTAEMSHAVAIGYDWLYDSLDAALRTRVAGVGEALRGEGLRPGIGRQIAAKRVTNWMQVCTGGTLAAALAIADEGNGELVDGFVRRVIDEFPTVLRMYEPNGAYPEGPGYWSYGTSYTVSLLVLLESAYGTDFGLGNALAFLATADFPDWMTGPSGILFNYSDGSPSRSSQWALWWFARRLKRPGLVESFERDAYVKALPLKQYGTRSPLALFYSFRREEGRKADEARPRVWRSGGTTDLAVLRSDWTRDARYAAFKGGRAVNGHGHMDGGSFIYEAKGIRWAIDLGSENYAKGEHVLGMGLWSYCQESPRYKVFRLSAEGHNTLTVDGQPHSVAGEVRVASIRDGDQPEAILDLSPLYPDGVSAYRRGRLERDGFTLSDVLTGLGSGSSVTWRMLTRVKARVEGGSVVLEQGGRTLTLSRNVPEGASPWQLEQAPHGAEWEHPNKDVVRISFTIPARGAKVKFDVRFD